MKELPLDEKNKLIETAWHVLSSSELGQMSHASPYSSGRTWVHHNVLLL